MGGKQMLKLAMRPGDSIRIGENIKVQLPEDVGCNVHLLVDAPREVEIKRQKREEQEKKGKIPNCSDTAICFPN